MGSDFESSPSPEETPSPTIAPKELFPSQRNKGFEYNRDVGSNNNEREKSPTKETPTGRPATKSQSFNNGAKTEELKDENHNSSERLSISGRHKKLMGSKWKNSISKLEFQQLYVKHENLS